MRQQSRPQGTRPANLWRSLWQQLRFPLSVGTLLGLTACTLTAISFGINPRSIFLISCMAGSALGIPILIVLIGYCLDSHDES